MAYLDHPDREFFILNGIYNTIPSLPQAIPLLTGQFLASWKARIMGKQFYALENSF